MREELFHWSGTSSFPHCSHSESPMSSKSPYPILQDSTPEEVIFPPPYVQAPTTEIATPLPLPSPVPTPQFPPPEPTPAIPFGGTSASPACTGARTSTMGSASRACDPVCGTYPCIRANRTTTQASSTCTSFAWRTGVPGGGAWAPISISTGTGPQASIRMELPFCPHLQDLCPYSCPKGLPGRAGGS